MELRGSHGKKEVSSGILNLGNENPAPLSTPSPAPRRPGVSPAHRIIIEQESLSTYSPEELLNTRIRIQKMLKVGEDLTRLSLLRPGLIIDEQTLDFSLDETGQSFLVNPSRIQHLDEDERALMFNRLSAKFSEIIWTLVDIGGVLGEELENAMRARGEEYKALARQVENKIELFEGALADPAYRRNLSPQAVASTESKLTDLRNNPILAFGNQLIREEQEKIRRGVAVNITEVDSKAPEPIVRQLAESRQTQNRITRLQLLTELTRTINRQTGQEIRDIPLDEVIQVFLFQTARADIARKMEGKGLTEQSDQLKATLFNQNNFFWVLKEKLLHEDPKSPAEQAAMQAFKDSLLTYNGDTDLAKVEDLESRLQRWIDEKLPAEEIRETDRRVITEEPKKDVVSEETQETQDQPASQRYTECLALLQEVIPSIISPRGEGIVPINVEDFAVVFLATNQEGTQVDDVLNLPLNEQIVLLEKMITGTDQSSIVTHLLHDIQTGERSPEDEAFLKTIGTLGASDLERIANFTHIFPQWLHQRLETERKSDPFEGTGQIIDFFGPLEVSLHQEFQEEVKGKKTVEEQRKEKEFKARVGSAMDLALTVFESHPDTLQGQQLKELMNEREVTAEYAGNILSQDPTIRRDTNSIITVIHRIAERGLIKDPSSGTSAGDFSLNYAEVATVVLLLKREDAIRGITVTLSPRELKDIRKAIKKAIKDKTKDLERSK